MIVPVGQDATYYLAKEEYDLPLEFEGNVISGEGVDLQGRPFEYDLPLRFEFEGNVISGEGVDLQGRPFEVGDLWRRASSWHPLRA